MLLEVRNLRTHFRAGSSTIKAVDGVNFTVDSGEILCIVGESGSGKSLTALSVLGLVEPPGKVESGEVLLEGRDILRMSSRELRKIRGKEIAMIFQDPMTSLNPVLRISTQMIELFKTHSGISRSDARGKSVEMLKNVGLPMAERGMRSFPFEMSGGMQQRISIAMALSLKPKILIADEPTTALDVSVQSQILELIRQLSEQIGTAVILITHDLGVVAEMADRVMVMYAGQVVEAAKPEDIFYRPGHPYTKGLLQSVPRIDGMPGLQRQIPGYTPDPSDLPDGCRFNPRCAKVAERCLHETPTPKSVSEGHEVACLLFEEKI